MNNFNDYFTNESLHTTATKNIYSDLHVKKLILKNCCSE